MEILFASIRRPEMELRTRRGVPSLIQRDAGTVTGLPRSCEATPVASVPRTRPRRPARLRRGNPPGPMLHPIKSHSRFGNHRGGRVRARASSASVVRESAGTQLAAEAIVMEEAILLTGESSECCDGR